MQVLQGPMFEEVPSTEVFIAWRDSMSSRFCALSRAKSLFTVDTSRLWSIYLTAMPIGSRQYHTCHTCKRFIESYGGIVYLDTDFNVRSAIWDVTITPEFYKPAVQAMIAQIEKSKIKDFFYCDDPLLGVPTTGFWSHFAVQQADNALWRTSGTDHSIIAEKREDFKNIQLVLKEWPSVYVDQVVHLLKTNQLYRSEKSLGMMTWLQQLYKDVHRVSRRANPVWAAIATAPAGFCHPRSSVIGSLMDDLLSGVPFRIAAERFAKKMHPTKYLRPQAPPKDTAIEVAERLIRDLGVAKSLDRRYADIRDIQEFLWRPTPAAPKDTLPGIFEHLKKSPISPDLHGPAITITWAKFQDTVLPTADAIAYYVPSVLPARIFTTATHFDAPPILQWDSPEHRNPVSSYMWHGGSKAASLSLCAGTYVDVYGIIRSPAHWNGCASPNVAETISFLLSGAREGRQGGLALFPETLKSTLHSCRAVIEAHSKRSALFDTGAPHVIGASFSKDSVFTHGQLWVTTGSFKTYYKIDRWD